MRRNATRTHDLAPPINIDQKGIQRARPLLDAPFQLEPFLRRKHPWEHIERDQSVGVAAFAVNGKGDADAAEQIFGLGLLHLAQLGRHGGHPVL